MSADAKQRSVQSLYRRPLPEALVPFSSPEGRKLFREALDAGTLESFFPLIEQFHTQSDPAFCGLASLVVALNTLGIDPGRLWKGPWRWFGEELLDCCLPLDAVRRTGVTMIELGCLARCNGADAVIEYADEADEGALRAAVREAAASASGHVVLASYTRKLLGQTGDGHFSPLGGYHAGRDLVLVLDVARFKYPPHWVPIQQLYQSMRPLDEASGRARGWMKLRPNGRPSSLTYYVSCRGPSWNDLLSKLFAEAPRALSRVQPTSAHEALGEFVRACDAVGLTSMVELRDTSNDEHAAAANQMRRALSGSRIFASVRQHLPDERAEMVSVLALAARPSLWEVLPPEAQSELFAWVAEARAIELLRLEIDHVSAQLDELERLLGPRRTAAEFSATGG